MAPASICTSAAAWTLASFVALLVASPPAWGEPPSEASEASARYLELEAVAAKTPDLYLVLSLDPPVLMVKARGIELDRVSLAGVVFLEHRAMFEDAAGSKLELPLEWRVEARPPDPGRRILAPSSLRSWTGEEETSSTPPPAAAPSLPEPPDLYSVVLSGGWTLEIGRDLVGAGFGKRMGQALADGWQTLRGRRPQRPPLIRVAMEAGDARRLHHLFRRDTRLLLVASAPGAPGP